MPSYEQRNKKWSVRFRVLEDGQESNKRLSGFATKKEAQQAYIQFINEQQKKRDKKVSHEDMLFEDLANAYLDHVKTRNKYSSWYSTKNKIDKHIIPYFKSLKIAEITPLVVLEWQNTLTGSFAYKQTLRGLLNSIYKFGDRYYDIRNVVTKVEPFRNLEPKKEMLFWSLEEFQQFIANVECIEHRMFFRTLYITGARKGEILALTWNDIEKNKIKISKSMTKKAEGKSFGITTPKNMSSVRDIDIPFSFYEDLMEYKKWQKQNYECTDFVFCGARPFADTTITRVFDNVCKISDVKKIRIHDFRHSCASLLISKGVSIVAVSKRLGHKNIEQTLNTYSHMMPNDVSMMVNILDGI